MKRREIVLKKTEEKDIYTYGGLVGNVMFNIYVKREKDRSVFLFDGRKKGKKYGEFRDYVKYGKGKWIYGKNEFKRREDAEVYVIEKMFKEIEKMAEEVGEALINRVKWRAYLGGKEKVINDGGKRAHSVKISCEKGGEVEGIYYLFIDGEKIERIDYRNEKRALRIFFYDYIFKKVEKEMEKIK